MTFLNDDYVRGRYLNDPKFHYLADTLHSLITGENFTEADLVEAVDMVSRLESYARTALKVPPAAPSD